MKASAASQPVMTDGGRPGACIELNDEDPAHVTIYEGRHRITPTRDAGVRRTVIQRSEITPA